MSEFKFSVGDRVAVRCSVNGYYRGTIKSINRYSWVEHPYVIIKDVNDKYYYTAKESELTRLVKKNPWGGFKVGQRVLADSNYHGKITGTIVELKRFIENEPVLKIKTDKYLRPLGEDGCWMVEVDKCTLIEDEKPKPKREPLRVGERVVVRPDENPLVRSGAKGKITDSRPAPYGEPIEFKVEFNSGPFQWLWPKQLKRLIKKPVVFKKGDRVRVKKVLGVKDLPEFKSKVIHVEIMDGHKMLRVDNPINPSDANWLHVRPQDCVKLRKRRLRVGDRVSTAATSFLDAGRGTIVRDEKADQPFLVKNDKTGEERWHFEKDCKRLVRKKKITSSPWELFVKARKFMESLRDKQNHIPASGKKVEDKDHIAGVGKKVEGSEVCKCSLFVYRSDKPTICIHCKGHLDSSSEKAAEFCECPQPDGVSLVYDDSNKHVANYIWPVEQTPGCGKTLKRLEGFCECSYIAVRCIDSWGRHVKSFDGGFPREEVEGCRKKIKQHENPQPVGESQEYCNCEMITLDEDGIHIDGHNGDLNFSDGCGRKPKWFKTAGEKRLEEIFAKCPYCFGIGLVNRARK